MNTELKNDVVSVTPATAREWLKLNMDNNRHLRPAVVRRYATDMRNGNWELTGVPIVFNKSGKLVDGQHRLNAVIRADVAVDMAVVRNVADSVKIYDRGIGRTTQDIFRIAGLDISSAEAALINGVFCYDFHINGGEVSDDMRIEYFEEKRGEIHDAINITRKGKQIRNNLTNNKASYLACYHAYRCGVDGETLSSFFTSANTGFAQEHQYAAIVFRNYLISKEAVNMDIPQTVCIAEQAIRDFSAGKPRRALYRSGEGLYVYKERFIKMDSELIERIRDCWA